MNPMHEAKRQMIQEIMKMAGEARMKSLKSKFAPKPPETAGETVYDEDDAKRPAEVGKHMELTDEELKSLLD